MGGIRCRPLCWAGGGRACKWVWGTNVLFASNPEAASPVRAAAFLLLLSLPLALPCLACLALAFLTRLGPHQQQGEGGTGRSSALPSPGWECGTLLLASAVAPPSRLCSLARTFRSGGKKEERRRKGRWLAAPTCPARLPDGSSRLVTGGGGGGMGAHVAAAAALFGPRRRPQQTSPQASGSGIGRRGVARPVPSRRGALSQGRTKPCSSPLPLGAAGWRLAPPPPRAAHRGSSSSRKTKEPRPSGAPSAA